jgi:2-polyprenyl-3-methyl-5-hydroxy-6-metoxy-1,4-benzoquinol methylase
VMSERKRWNDLASEHPYWTVLIDPRYRADRIGPDDVQAFFESGERDVSRTLSAIRRSIAPGFLPRRALDYGCGVGRLTIPIAREAQHVVGVDVSESMLSEARRNCVARGIANVDLIDSRDFLAADDTRFVFDFVYSYIVLQHIPPRTGLSITDCLLRRLAPGGVAALHYTYARKASLLRRIVHPMRRWLLPLNVAVNVIQRRPMFEPMIPVYQYDLAKLLQLFQEHGCTSLCAELTDHGGHSGVMFMLRKGG